MAVFLGIDTGGTFTDAVLWDEEGARVLAKAKALTTKTDLSVGIGAAIDAVLAQGVATADQIALVSLSTTLATNALVEGHGGRAGLVFIGFDERDLSRAGLAEALGSDPLIALPGGHDTGGGEVCPLDLEALVTAARAAAPTLDAFAVVSRFATRNPAHERAARTALAEATGLPVTCGHELSDALNGPKRALTALLNARLIGMIADLIAAARGVCAGAGLSAPLMLVRGDGALVSAEFAAERPIETILSGPAASLVGATALTGVRDGIVSDIGGTTTDIALLTDGLPRLSPRGARVGGFETMVAAVDMATHGLGGDSEVQILVDGLAADILLGPQKAMPLSLLAHTHPGTLEMLTTQMRRETPQDQDARFGLATGRVPRTALSPVEDAVFAPLSAGPCPLDTLCPTRQKLAAFARLRRRGLVSLASMTPTDAAHVLDLHKAWSGEAARLGAALLARKRDGKGQVLAERAEGLASRILDALTRRTATHLLETVFDAEGLGAVRPGEDPMVAALLDGTPRLIETRLRLATPLIALGASAATHYGAVAQRLAADLRVPEHADVANAVGAVAGQVRLTRALTVAEDPGGGLRVFLPEGPTPFAAREAALRAAESALTESLRAAAAQAGAPEAPITLQWTLNEAKVEGRTILVEGTLTGTATGRPATLL